VSVLGLERARQLRDRGKLFRAYGAVPADSVQPEYRQCR